MKKEIQVGQEVFVLNQTHFDRSFYGKVVKFEKDPLTTHKEVDAQGDEPIVVEITSAKRFAVGTIATCPASMVFVVVPDRCFVSGDGVRHKVVYDNVTDAAIEPPYYCPDMDESFEENEVQGGSADMKSKRYALAHTIIMDGETTNDVVAVSMMRETLRKKLKEIKFKAKYCGVSANPNIADTEDYLSVTTDVPNRTDIYTIVETEEI